MPRSCDAAFTVEDDRKDDLIYISVQFPTEADSTNLGLAIGLPVAFLVLLLIFILMWQDTKRKENDMVRRGVPKM